jgi:hypothetical protein
MNKRRFALFVLATAFAAASASADAQVRGVYPPGMTATNAGVTPESGFTYANVFLLYSRDTLKGPDGETVSTGSNAVILGMNSFVWVSKREFLNGAKFSMSATLPLTNNSLTSDTEGTISGGGGFADSYYQPFILGWTKKRVAIRAVYGFLAPTGHFDPDGTSNVGSGYWTHAPSSGQTWYLSDNKTTAISAFQMYEFHTTQEGTGIRPGDTFDLDYSVMQTLKPRDDMRVQIGLVGYGQWQTTDKSGPGLTPAESAAHYGVNALGFGANLVLPQRKASLGFKYFEEFSNRSTFQGYSTQISGSITF